MMNPPAYNKQPAADLGPALRPFPTLAVGLSRAVRVYQDGWDDLRSDYTCAAYLQKRTMTSTTLMTFCVLAEGAQ